MKSELENLVEHLISKGVLKNPSLINSFLVNDRKLFVPENLRDRAYQNIALPICGGQTISQPYTVAFMMELLEPKTGDQILDVGFGSGWTTAILANIVGAKGRIRAVEIVKEVYSFGKTNLEKFNYHNMELVLGSWSDLQPQKYDCILVSAATSDISIPQQLATLLKAGGRLVIPVKNRSGQSICLIKKTKENKLFKKDFPGFIFVPLI